MKKGTLIIGGTRDLQLEKVNEVFSKGLGFDRKTIEEDGMDSQQVVLIGIDGQLKEVSLDALTRKMTVGLPHAQVIASVESMGSLTEEDVAYALEHFYVFYSTNSDFLLLEEDELFIEGIPFRLVLAHYAKSTPQFFNHIHEVTFNNALEVLLPLVGENLTFRHLEDLLWNNASRGEKYCLDASQLEFETKLEMKKCSDALNWFMQDYYTGSKGSRNRTKTYEQSIGLRSLVSRYT